MMMTFVVVSRHARGKLKLFCRWKPTPVPDEDCFASIKAGIDALPLGAKMFLNSGALCHIFSPYLPTNFSRNYHYAGEFYGQGETTANLELVARFFDKYPSYADKAFLSVKGGNKLHSLQPDGSPENLRRSVDYILEKLRGTKSLDLFECARYDATYPLEDSLKVLQGFIKEGKFKYIGLSEVSAATVRRAHRAASEVAAVEIEVSPWSYTQETKEGEFLVPVLAARREIR